jgi:type III secretion system (T3SS) inner membrane Yop/YscD-like protein/type III secretion system (T3SS) inner membrane Yop/CscD-like protein
MSLPNPTQSARDAVPADLLLLEVVAGRHAGVRVPLDAAGCCIGSAGEADVMLRDPGVAPVHVRLELDRSGLRIEAAGADVGVGDEVLPLGHGRRVRLPAELILGEARLCISKPATSSRSDGVRRWRDAIGARHAVAAGTLVVSLVALSVIAFGLPHGAGERPAGTMADARVPAAPPGAPASLEEAMRELTHRIDQARLRSLRVGILDGSVSVTGRLAKREAEAWRTIERWFDQTYSGRLVLAAKVTVGDSRTLPPPQLRAIWFGVRPYIITADGARHEPGSVLDNGWLVSEIGERRLLLAKDGETLDLTYP